MIVSALLASLGFSCIPMGAEYGTPSATYKAAGIVVCGSDDSPLEGVRASLLRVHSNGNYIMDTTYTGPEGRFFLQGSEFPGSKLNVELLHLNGEITGSFTRMVLEADYSKETFTGSSGSWYEGSALIDFGTIKMQLE